MTKLLTPTYSMKLYSVVPPLTTIRNEDRTSIASFPSSSTLSSPSFCSNPLFYTHPKDSKYDSILLKPSQTLLAAQSNVNRPTRRSDTKPNPPTNHHQNSPPKKYKSPTSPNKLRCNRTEHFKTPAMLCYPILSTSTTPPSKNSI